MPNFDFDDEDDEDEFDSGEANFTCVGNFYREEAEREAFENLESGTAVFLVPEPDNPYDSNAIKIVLVLDGMADLHLGFVPRTENESLRETIDSLGGFEAVYGKFLVSNLFVLKQREAAD